MPKRRSLDNTLFKEERATIERAWPAFAKDMSLCRPPAWAYGFSPPCTTSPDAMLAEGMYWDKQYKKRLQHVLSRMNHHIHPLCNPEDDMETGQRRPLSSCTTKAKPKLCRGNFPLDNEMTDVPNRRCHSGSLGIHTGILFYEAGLSLSCNRECNVFKSRYSLHMQHKYFMNLANRCLESSFSAALCIDNRENQMW